MIFFKFINNCFFGFYSTLYCRNNFVQHTLYEVIRSAGEPDFDTPDVIKQAAIKAINDGQTKYTAVEGTVETKKAIINKLKKDHGLEYNLDEIIVSNGAKHSLFNLFQCLLEDGDEVIIPAPYWVTYPEQVKYSGGVPVFIDTDDTTSFKITADP